MTVVRPAPMFGFEDRLLHRSLNATNLLSCNNMQERFWPVHCIDLGAALEQIRMDDTTVGLTYELHGPKEYNMMELKEMVGREISPNTRLPGRGPLQSPPPNLDRLASAKANGSGKGEEQTR
ncbi:Protein-lysine N-methyltransferase efm5 [Friedmanniomyces endolithicus]|nr:Protein-lysine N-methyltransferase efm5 [Friedmanniomyces endolithicus]KAK0302765.1 Protein-lysine N-methyltransferase efm5 [Friedmanniomyces endolithicus]KAK0823310.1 Protein-lysine N-methyltransferase efm5 [Friedmanniomyces endolithicus]